MKAWMTGLLLAAAAGAAVAPRLAGQEEGIGIGKAAPVVSVPDLQGRPVDLGQYIGKRPMLLEFWATWCPICEALLPRMQAAHTRYGNQVAFLGINVAVNQTRDRVRRYMEHHDMPFQVLYDEDGVSTRAYDAPQTSYIVIIDRSGRIAYTGVGTEQQFEAALQKVAGN